MELSFDNTPYLLMGGELGHETYINVILESLALFPQNVTLIGNDFIRI